jgi:hypothetical protein
VKIKADAPSPQFNDPNRIKGARYGFTESPQFAAAELLLDGADAIPFSIYPAESAFFRTFHKRSDYIPVTVYLEETFCIDCCPSGTAHKGRINGICLFQRLQFLFLERSSAIPYYTATPFADRIVAGKELGDDIF